MPRTDQTEFEQLLVAQHPCVAMQAYEEQHAVKVVVAAATEANKDVMLWSAGTGIRDGLVRGATPVPDTSPAAGALAWICQQEFRPGVVYILLDLAPHLTDATTARMLRDAINHADANACTIVLIDGGGELPPAVRSVAAHHELSFPGEEELEQIVRATLRELNNHKRINVEISRADLTALVRNLRGLTRRQAEQAVLETVAHDCRFDGDDVTGVLRTKRRMLAGTGLLDFVEAPLDMDQIGGLDNLKHWLQVRERSLSESAAEFGIDPPRGMLLLGVQGAGKSLAAKAVATAWKRPLLRMDVGALYDRFIGESEKRLREALRQAEMAAPVVLWIDEIEKAFASAASTSNDGGLSRRMFGALLTWMQEHKAPVFLIATANDIEALPPELLRKGRFDEIFFVDLPDEAGRRKILEIHLAKRNRKPADYDLDRLVKTTAGYSGAEIEQGIIAAMHESFAARSDLDTDRLVEAIKASPPLSVTMAEKITNLRRWAKGRCVDAG
ncbi:MAG: AAA family ATPase [Planctomycetota bacterium]